MKYDIRIIQQFDGQKEPFWGSAYTEDGLAIAGCRGTTAEEVKSKLQKIINYFNKEKVVFEGEYDAKEQRFSSLEEAEQNEQENQENIITGN